MPFNPATDYLSVHGDFAPDHDEYHATAAHYTLIKEYGVQNYGFVVGAYGLNASQVHFNLPQFKQQFFRDGGIEFIDADADYQANGNFDVTGAQLGQAWLPTLQAGGDVYVAEGGQSDITLEAVKFIQSQGFSASRVTVVQHSTWNINNTSPGVVAELQSRGANWVRIEDGNHPNSTPDWNDGSTRDSFWSAALSSPYAREWQAAYNSFTNPNRIDFSDAVETAHILGIPTGEIATVALFSDQFFTPEPVMPTVSTVEYNPSVMEGETYNFGIVSDGSHTEPITITYRVYNARGAVSGVDFEPGQGNQDQLNPLGFYEGTTTLEVGQSFVSVNYDITDDGIVDPGERVRFKIMSATGADIGQDSTFLDIIDTGLAAPPLFSLDIANTGQGGSAYDEIIDGGTVELSGSQNFFQQTLIGRYNGTGGIGSMKIQTYANDQLIYSRTESAAPYTQFGDSGGNLFEGNGFSDGSYRTVLTGFSGANGSGDILGSQEFNYVLTDLI